MEPPTVSIYANIPESGRTVTAYRQPVIWFFLKIVCLRMENSGTLRWEEKRKQVHTKIITVTIMNLVVNLRIPKQV